MPSNGKQQNDQEFNDCAVVIDAELQNEPSFGDSGFPSRNTFDMNSLSIPKSDFAAKVEIDSNILKLEQCSTFDEEMMIISRYEEKRQIATKARGLLGRLYIGQAQAVLRVFQQGDILGE